MSNIFKFHRRTTRASMSLIVGQSFGGGYYAGQITDNGILYNLIVSPRYASTSALLAWKTSNTSGPIGAQSTTDGFTTTNNMITANSPSVVYPIAHLARTARTNLVGTKNDWYVPAINEMIVIYNNLNPQSSSTPTIFKTNGAQALETSTSPSFYWSTTEVATDITRALPLNMNAGTTPDNDKINTFWVRLIRREVA